MNNFEKRLLLDYLDKLCCQIDFNSYNFDSFFDSFLEKFRIKKSNFNFDSDGCLEIEIIKEKKVLLKRASDLISPYVGETEQNIATAFSEAKSKKAMLIFDEADTFLQDRNNAVRSWEVAQGIDFGSFDIHPEITGKPQRQVDKFKDSAFLYYQVLPVIEPYHNETDPTCNCLICR